MAMAMIWTRTGIGGWPLCPVHKTHLLGDADSDLGIAVWSAGERDRVPVGELSET